MYLAYAVVALLTAALNAFSAWGDVVRLEVISRNMDRAGVPRSWMPGLAVPKAAGALGLLAGLWVPVLGLAAAVGLVVYFVLATGAHLRVRDRAAGPHHLYLLMAVATLVLTLAAR